MFTQSIGNTDRFDHLADDELALIREEALTKMHTMRRTRVTARYRDLEQEAGLIADELQVRKKPAFFRRSRNWDH